METMLSIFGIGAIASIVNSITTLSANMINIMSNVNFSQSIYTKDINMLLKQTDVKKTVELLQTMIEERIQYNLTSKTVHLALANVEEIIRNITNILNDVNNKIMYNESLYIFKNWRSYTFSDELDELKCSLDTLKIRKHDLFETLKVFDAMNLYVMSMDKHKALSNCAKHELGCEPNLAIECVNN